MIYKEIPVKTEGSADYAKLCVYIQEKSPEIPYSNKRKIVLICPGGGYHLTTDREAEAIAVRIMSMGYHAAVLRYSVSPVRYPVALLEVAQSVSILRAHAEEWNIQPDKLVVMGFSAGGHVAASYGVFWNEDFVAEKTGVDKETLRPNAMLLCYPVISSKEDIMHEGSFRHLLGENFDNPRMRAKMSLEDQVSADTPKCFIWHTYTDDNVPVENSFVFVRSLLEQKIPVEFHLYERGGHGLGLANEQTDNQAGQCCQEECQSWISLAETWLRNV